MPHLPAGRLAIILALLSSPLMAASGPSASTSKSTAITPSRTTRSGTAAKGPLPDPALLDGSKQVAEKKSEHGMLGEFELPGNDGPQGGERSDKVGGQQGQPGVSASVGLPSAGSAGGQQGGQQGQQGGAAGGLPGMQSAGAEAGAAGGQPGSPPPNGQQGGAGSPGSIAAGDQNGQQGGTQVGQLQTPEGVTDGQGGPGGPGEKPKQIALGDSGMRINTLPSSAGVVGNQQAGPTQNHEKGTGTGGGQGPSGNGTNKGVEKGRVMPAGL